MAFRIQAPVYEQRVAPSVRPGYRQNRGDLVSRAQQGLAQSVGQVGEVGEQLVKMGAQMREEQQRAALLTARTELQRNTEELLSDPNNGLVAQRGDMARQNRESFLTYYKANTDRIKKTLDPSLVEKFDEFTADDGIRFQQSVDVHVAREQERFAAGALDAHLDAIPSLAVGAAQRGEQDQAPGIIALGLGTIDAEASRPGGALAGKPKEVVDALRLGLTTKAHVGVLGELLQRGRLDEAKGYFEVSRGQIDPLQIAKIEERLNAGDHKAEVLATADVIFREAPNMERAMYAASVIANPQMRLDVEGRLGNLYQQKTSNEHQRWNPEIDSIHTRLLSGGPVSWFDDDVEQIKADGPEWAKTKLAAIVFGAQEREERMRTTAGRQAQTNKDREDWYNFMSLPRFGNPGEDIRTADIAAKFPGASDWNVSRMKAAQQRASEEFKNDQGGSYQNWITKVRALTAGMSPKKQKKILAAAGPYYDELKSKNLDPRGRVEWGDFEKEAVRITTEVKESPEDVVLFQGKGTVAEFKAKGQDWTDDLGVHPEGVRRDGLVEMYKKARGSEPDEATLVRLYAEQKRKEKAK